jgi:subtilisin family serine protease
MKTDVADKNRTIPSFSPLVSVFTTLAPAMLAFCCAAVQPSAQAQPTPAAQSNAVEEFVEDELLVGFKPGTAGAQVAAVRNGFGAAKIKGWSEISAEHWHLPRGLGVARAIQALSANPNVVYAEPNYISHASEIPDDPMRDSQWPLHNIGQADFGQIGGTPDADLDALEAWGVSHNGTSVVVGIIDSGIDYLHPDLAPNIWLNPGESGTDSQGRRKETNGIDDDGNGYIDDVHGWDFVNNDNDPMDDNSHGTHVAGTVGAVGNNGVGICGLAWSVKLMPLKILNKDAYGPLDAGVSALLYATKFVEANGGRKVRITSNSYTSVTTKSKTVENAIKACNALFVAAAGNNGSNIPQYPAAYAQPNVISVAATDKTDSLASFSNYGPSVNLAAPGVDILSTTPNNHYSYKSGTSMSAPHVSGVAAMILDQNPSWSISDLRTQILNSVDVLPALAGKVSTSGRLNARKAVGAPEFAPDTTAPAAVIDLAASLAAPTSVTLTWTAPADDSINYQYEIRYSSSPITTDAEFQGAVRFDGEPNPATGGSTETFTIENLHDQSTFYFALKTIDLFGNVSPLSNMASVTTTVADWFYIRLDWGQHIGNSVSLDVTPAGYWAVAYDDPDAGILKCAYLSPSGQGYRIDSVGSGGSNPSVAYSPAAEISISHRFGAKLYFVNKLDTNWISTVADSKDVGVGDTSLVFGSSGTPWISYYKAGRNPGLGIARRTGTSWTTQLIDSGAKAIYNQITVDSSGNPTVAYSHDANNDGVVDTLKFAHFDGSTWSKSTIDTGGSYVTVAYSPIDGQPALAHWNAMTGQLRFVRWDGASWNAEVVLTAPSVTGCSLAFGPDGIGYIAFGTDEMLLAKRDLSGVWTMLSVDPSTPGGLRNSLHGRPGGRPTAVAFRGPNDRGYQVGPDPASSVTVRLAIRQTPYQP